MTHTQNTPKTAPVQPETCPESSPLAVLGPSDPLVTAQAFDWPGDSDVDHDDDLDALTIENGSIRFANEVKPVLVDGDTWAEWGLEPAPKSSRRIKVAAIVILAVIAILLVAAMASRGPIGGAA